MSDKYSIFIKPYSCVLTERVSQFWQIQKGSNSCPSIYEPHISYHLSIVGRDRVDQLKDYFYTLERANGTIHHHQRCVTTMKALVDAAIHVGGEIEVRIDESKGLIDEFDAIVFENRIAEGIKKRVYD